MIIKLILANSLRWPIRSVFTILSIASGFSLLVVMLPLERVLTVGVDLSEEDRLVVVNRSSFLRPLPVRYREEISNLENVSEVGHITFFGAYYQSFDRQIPALVTDFEHYFEFVNQITFESAIDDWYLDPRNIAVGRELADEYNWKVGDIVPIFSSRFLRSDGGKSWTFRVGSIMESLEEDVNTGAIIVNYNYFNESRILDKDTVGWLIVQMTENGNADSVASEIDSVYENSAFQTRTTSESMFARGFLRQIGDFSLMIRSALGVVFLSLIFVVINTISHSIKERAHEIALIRLFGFRKKYVFSLIFTECLILCLVGALLGAVLGIFMQPLFSEYTDNLIPELISTLDDVGVVFVSTILLALLSSIIPTFFSLTSHEFDALRKNNLGGL